MSKSTKVENGVARTRARSVKTTGQPAGPQQAPTEPFGFGEGDAEGRARFVYMNVPDLPLGPGLSEVAEAICRRHAQAQGIAALLGAVADTDSVSRKNVDHAALAIRDLLDQADELTGEMLRMGTEAREDLEGLQTEANHGYGREEQSPAPRGPAARGLYYRDRDS